MGGPGSGRKKGSGGKSKNAKFSLASAKNRAKRAKEDTGGFYGMTASAKKTAKGRLKYQKMISARGANK